MHNWICNDSEMFQDITSSEDIYKVHSQQLPVKALGMLWKLQPNYFFFKIGITIKDSYSQREVLSETAKINDSVGLIGPIVTKARIFMKNLRQLKVEFNEHLLSNSLQEWKQFLLKLTEIYGIAIS